MQIYNLNQLCTTFVLIFKNKIMNTQNKILNFNELENKISRFHFFQKKIVFTNGCFDLLHLGHIDYLEKARNEGDL